VLAGKEPAAGADVHVLGTALGVSAGDDGEFRIAGVPVGSAVVLVAARATCRSRSSAHRRRGERRSDDSARADPTAIKTIETVEVRGERMINLGLRPRAMTRRPRSGSPSRATSTRSRSRPASLRRGRGDPIRGSRSAEVKLQIDGFSVNNPLTAG
jgi:hypothetical protein